VIGAHSAVVAGDGRVSPISPAGVGGPQRRRSRRLFWPREQSVGLAEGAAWNARASALRFACHAARADLPANHLGHCDGCAKAPGSICVRSDSSNACRPWSAIDTGSSTSQDRCDLESADPHLPGAQDRVVMWSRRTKRRGAATRWLAGHHTAQAPGSRPSGKRSSCKENSSACGGAWRSASIRSARPALPSNRWLAFSAALGGTAASFGGPMPCCCWTMG
jgi:hypothetical protein